jgi:hypothetical protein
MSEESLFGETKGVGRGMRGSMGMMMPTGTSADLRGCQSKSAVSNDFLEDAPVQWGWELRGEWSELKERLIIIIHF